MFYLCKLHHELASMVTNYQCFCHYGSSFTKTICGAFGKPTIQISYLIDIVYNIWLQIIT